MTNSRFSVSRETTLRAQELRRDATPCEKLLWSKLKNTQLCGLRFRRQHAVGPYILDFYCPMLRLAVEVDGDSHSAEGAAKRDRSRTDYLAAKGIKVIRFWNSEIHESLVDVVERILLECEGIDRRRGGT